jgi:predicted transcriptional regulator
MAKTIKFTEEEVNSINQLRLEVANVFTQLGQISIEKKRRMNELESVEAQLLQKHSELQQQEQEIFKGLNEKYGDGNYDPQTGEFTPTSEDK